MSNELGLTPIEKELRFSVWCKENGVLRFLLDLDDTVCATRGVFGMCMNNVFDYLEAIMPVQSRRNWQEIIEVTNNRLFEKVGVNPNRWNMMVDELSELYQLPIDVQVTTKQLLAQIYLTPPTILDGVEEGLVFLTKVGMPIGIVTHAGLEWTWRKYNWLDLERFVNWDDVFIVDENKHKTSESWVQAVRYFGLNPEQCAVVGDSPRSDINPAWSVGIKQCFLVEDPSQWSIHKQPVDQCVKKIANLSKIIDAIL